MKKTFLDTLVPGACIVLAFFLWYMYAHREIELKYQDTKNQLQYIDISTSTKNITIKNSPENVFFRVNGELLQTGSIDLK